MAIEGMEDPRDEPTSQDRFISFLVSCGFRQGVSFRMSKDIDHSSGRPVTVVEWSDPVAETFVLTFDEDGAYMDRDTK